MNPICSLLKPDNVMLGLGASSKKRVFEQAAQTISLLYGLDRKEVFEALFARERLGSTYLDYGICLPHCRLPNLSEPRALFVRLHGEIPVTTDGSHLAHSFFFLLVPENAATAHLEILAGAAELFSDENTRKELETSSTAENFCEKLQAICQQEKL